jgi:spore coat polysaccharide biosynthesis protein SpsF
VLLDLAGEPMLVRCVERLRRAETLDEVVVATTVEPEDDVVVALCAARGLACSRGSRDDVLDRYCRAAREHRADVIVRVTSDCPLIEPEIVDRVVRTRARSAADLASNVVPQHTFPRGLDAEAFTREALERAWRDDHRPEWREHVTIYIKRHPEIFRVASVRHDRDLSHLRWTVDTVEDLTFVQRVYEHFGHDAFSWTDVLDVLVRYPEWTAINAHVHQKEVPE